MLNFDIQNHKPLREMVYEELKIQILTGAIVPGTRMMEVDLAEEMGVSRTPIREAIRKLEKEGLVTIEPRRGAYASMISTQDMVEILEVRQDLEGLAAYFAATRMTPVEMEELREVADHYNEAVAELQELVLRFRYIYYDNFKRAENMPEEHREIIEAIASGDETRARQAADVHIDRLKQMVIEEGVQQNLVSEE